MVTDKGTTYTAKGFVLGYYWGGGSGAYPTIQFEADTKENLIDKIKKALDDGSIDSGMGFESLKGTLMNITTITQIKYNDKIFTNKESEEELIGNHLTDEDIQFLYNLVY